MATSHETQRRRQHRLHPLVGLVALVVALLVLFAWLRGVLLGQVSTPMLPDEQCVVRVGSQADSLDLEQSGNAAIIVAESIRRGLPARAASIALATAMQESNLRNIDYGDRDSLGLFQQRPSQGWGTEAQIMDPWYSSGKFYEHLVKVAGWQGGDINDVAQAVQRSGVPDGYRKHVEKAKVWGSALTGHSPAAVSCIDRGSVLPNTSDATALLTKAFGSSVKSSVAQARVTLNSADETQLWAATQLFMMTTRTSGVTSVDVGQRSWTMKPDAVADWTGTATPKPTEAAITLRS